MADQTPATATRSTDIRATDEDGERPQGSPNPPDREVMRQRVIQSLLACPGATGSGRPNGLTSS
jgi:hypothetical protein